MLGLLRYVGLRHLRHTPLRTALVALSATLGIAMVVSVEETVPAAARALTHAVEEAAGRAQLEVVALDEAGLDESWLALVRRVPGVGLAIPVIEVQAHVAGTAGRTLRIAGLDLLDGATLDFYDTALEGEGLDDSLVFLAKADSIAVGREFAERSGLALGSTIGLVTSQGRRDFVVRGLLERTGRGLGVGGDVGLMDLYAAQQAFGRGSRLDRIDVAFAAGADAAATIAALRGVIGGAAAVAPPATRGGAVDQMLLSFRLMAAFLSLIALAAACFLIFSVTAIAVAQRRHQVGVLRALGATRRQVVGLFVGEATLLGGLATVAGVGAGVWAARAVPEALAWLAEATFQVKPDTPAPAGAPGMPLLSGLVGLGTIVAAALLAARHAATVPVVGALRALPAGESVRRGRRRRLVLAAALSALSIAAVQAQRQSRLFLVGGTADLLILLAAFVAAPALIAAIAPRLIAPARTLFGAPAELALRNVARQGERLAAPVVILTMGLHLVITVGAIAASFEQSVLGWLAQGSALDLVVTASGTLAQRSAAPLDEALADELRTVTGVAEVRPIRETRARFRDAEIGVRAWALATPPTARDIARFTFLEGDPRSAIAQVVAGSGALVSQNLAAHLRLAVGDPIELPTPHGPVRFTIAGVVLDYMAQTGTVIVGREHYLRLWQDRLVDAFGIGLAPGAAAQATRERITARLGARFDLVVLTTADYLDEVRALIHRAFFPLRAIEVVTVVIGLLSLLNALLLSVTERFREFGVLRASGASPRQLVRMVLLEAVAIGVIAALLGTAIGVYGSHGWIRVHIPAATGWIVQYAFPLVALGNAVGGALVAVTLVAIYPGRLAARTSVMDALRAA